MFSSLIERISGVEKFKSFDCYKAKWILCFELGKLIDRFQHNYENTTNYRNYRNPIMYMLVP